MNASLMNRGEPSTVMQTGRSGQRLEEPSVEPKAAVNSPWTLFLLCMIAILPFWTVRYPVVTDYPNHLARWFVLFHMKDGAYHFADLYAPAWGPLPYISPDVLAMALQYFLPIDVVGRCLLSLCVILLAYATYFFLKEACPENVGLASFGIFMALNPNLQMGSISNEFSLAFCLLVVGLWVRYCRVPKVITAVGIATGLLLVYLSHLSGFMIAGLAMGVFALFQEQRWRKLGILAVLSLPALLIFAHDPSHGGGGATFEYGTVWNKVKDLLFPLRLYTSKPADLIVLAGLAFLVFLLLKNRPKSVFQPVWLAVCGVSLFTYFVAPGNYGLIGYIDTRFLPFAYLFSLAVFRFDRVPRSVYVGLALLVLFRVATWEQLFISQQRELAQLSASFEAIPRNAKVLPLARLPESGVIGTATIHHSAYGVIQRGFLDPMLFHHPGIQPIRLVGSLYCPNIRCDVAGEPKVDWQQVANSYDYLWVNNDPDIKTFTSRIGDVIFSNDSVTVCRVR
jgi:hypothetical protein